MDQHPPTTSSNMVKRFWYAGFVFAVDLDCLIVADAPPDPPERHESGLSDLQGVRSDDWDLSDGHGPLRQGVVGRLEQRAMARTMRLVRRSSNTGSTGGTKAESPAKDKRASVRQ